MSEIIEQKLIEAVSKIIIGRVNELLDDFEFSIPPAIPSVSLSMCERTEKERIILEDAYSLTIKYIVPETSESEMYCHAYASAVCKAFAEKTTLGGVADRVTVTNKKYIPPKVSNSGMEWEVIISLRITVEGMKND
jgi:hypothetical protein